MSKEEEAKPFKDMQQLTEVAWEKFKKKPFMSKKEEPKQETLEEAAKIHLNSGKIPNDYQSFITGAKWQQEQIYNQIKELYDNEDITGFSKRAYAQCLDIIEQIKNK